MHGREAQPTDGLAGWLGQGVAESPKNAIKFNNDGFETKSD